MSNTLLTKSNTTKKEGNGNIYLQTLYEKCNKPIADVKHKCVVDSSNVIMPTHSTYNYLLVYKYNIAQLKTFAKHYKLKISGSKKELFLRLYSFLKLSHCAIKIQKIIRKMFVKKYIQLHGPALFNRSACINENDFISMESIKDIEFVQFISYKDVDNFIYGFDINSLHNLFKSNNAFKNPYNRNVFPKAIVKNIERIITLSQILHIPLNLTYEDDTHNLSV